MLTFALLSAGLGAGFTQATLTPDRILSRLESVATDAVQPLLAILVIVLISFGLLRLLSSSVRTIMARLMEREDQPHRDLALKANTLAHVIESAGRVVIVVVAGMMVLSKLGLNIAPLLASAGVVGIAIGLGAQSLIKDLIGGFFILLENQFGVGDVITVGSYSGLVEHLSLRRTGLRATDGSVIVIPNGDIRAVTNMTKGWSRAVVDVPISYEDDVDHALEVLRGLVATLEDDPQLGDAVLGPAEIPGVESFGPYQVTLRMLVKTRPMEQWRVQRELRRRIKLALAAAGITIPYQGMTPPGPRADLAALHPLPRRPRRRA
ncbi:MAG TPA: mechanosensitive ion channel family protein [Thermomicrobiaceae bacterium]|nr:mechanosensitive ion channel family protein [Thermomicrobiaceae bacterium]